MIKNSGIEMRPLIVSNHKVIDTKMRSMPTYIGLRVMLKIPLVTRVVVSLVDRGLTVVLCFTKLKTAGVRKTTPATNFKSTNQLGALKFMMGIYLAKAAVIAAHITNKATGGTLIFRSFNFRFL